MADLPRLFPDRHAEPVAPTPVGSTRFEAARLNLARLASREPEQVTDADVVVFLAIGETAARTLLGHPDR